MVKLVEKVSNEEGGLDFQLSCTTNWLSWAFTWWLNLWRKWAMRKAGLTFSSVAQWTDLTEHSPDGQTCGESEQWGRHAWLSAQLRHELIKLSNPLVVKLVGKVSNEEGGLDFQLSCAMNWLSWAITWWSNLWRKWAIRKAGFIFSSVAPQTDEAEQSPDG